MKMKRLALWLVRTEVGRAHLERLGFDDCGPCYCYGPLVVDKELLKITWDGEDLEACTSLHIFEKNVEEVETEYYS